MVNPVGAFGAPNIAVFTGPRIAAPAAAPPAPDVFLARAPSTSAPPPIEPSFGPSEFRGRGPGRQAEAPIRPTAPQAVAPQVLAQQETGDGPTAAETARPRQESSDTVSVDASQARIREAALAKLAAYQMERSRRYPDGGGEGDYRKALEAMRTDVLFFGSLSPVERALPEIARAMQSAEVILPLRELSLVDVGKGDPRAPIVKLAGTLAGVVDEAGREDTRLPSGEQVGLMLGDEVWRLLDKTRNDPAFQGVFSAESESLIDRKLREAEAAREAAKAAGKDGRVSLLA